MTRLKKRVALAGILLAMVGFILWIASPGTLAQGGESVKEYERRQLAVLRDVFRGQNVSVFFINGSSPPMEGQVKGITELFGKPFLRLETSNGNARLALIEQIVAVRQKDK